MVIPFPEVAASTPNNLGRSATVGTPPELPPDAVVAAPPPAAVVAAPPDAVVAAPPPDAVVALVPLPELSPPHAASTLGARATAAPAAPSRVSTCRRVTRPWCSGRPGSISAILMCSLCRYRRNRRVARAGGGRRDPRGGPDGRGRRSPSLAPFLPHVVLPLVDALPLTNHGPWMARDPDRQRS